MKTADLVDSHDAEVAFCHLPFLSFGQISSFNGPIQTVKSFEDNVLLKAELSKPGNGRILVVDGGGSTRLAILGDIIAGIMHDNHWAGIIINGAIRDSEEVNAMEVAVRCLGTSPKKSAKTGDGQVGIPVSFGGVTFAPGHWVYVDADGVLVARKQLVLPEE
ncbi:ribonuclease E activity regulator RraA [Marinicella sediminis]|uniref:4-hydroxy-4-methyl-2-oxoglutarate aldolase n=1 Tax=Marinicella sediminis TaxID=1792834 RepID=A0ABV7JBI9_9GAMM|nr:ribonuclease E activity regulator RraA [Marinicella sediminis]